MDFAQLPGKTPLEKENDGQTLHRRIELQSTADLHYLQRNLARAARERLDLHFPHIPAAQKPKPATVISLDGARRDSQLDKANRENEQAQKPAAGLHADKEDEDEDPLRKRVRLLVDEFLQNTYLSAAHSISVNGNDANSLSSATFPSCSNPDPQLDAASTNTQPVAEQEGTHFTYAPFDAKLQKKLAGLHGELESLTAQVSRLRREAPKTAATAYTAQLEANILEEDVNWEQEEKKLDEERDGHEGLEIGTLTSGNRTMEDWNREVKETYDLGVKMLGTLSATDKNSGGKSLTETVGKVQRARTVALEFE